jgi:hypothetical protein
VAAITARRVRRQEFCQTMGADMEGLLIIAAIGFAGQILAQLVGAYFAYVAAKKLDENTKLTSQTHDIVNANRQPCDFVRRAMGPAASPSRLNIGLVGLVRPAGAACHVPRQGDPWPYLPGGLTRTFLGLSLFSC